MSTPIPTPEQSQSQEPALKVGAITTIASAVLSAFVAFGLDLGPAKTAAILGVVAAAAPIIAAWITRGKVYSPASVAELLDIKRR